MARVNKRAHEDPIHTHEGARAVRLTPKQQLRRLVMTCMLWEKQYYESGHVTVKYIKEMISHVTPQVAADMAIEARNSMKLRHVPLLIAYEMTKLPAHKALVGELLPKIIQRADELSEFISIYWKDGKRPLSGQTKKGLSRAFNNFDDYQLAKWNRGDEINLRDVLFLAHAKPVDGKDYDDRKREYEGGRFFGWVRRHNDGKGASWAMLKDGELPIPETWENRLMACRTNAEKKAAWEDLLQRNKLGALALIRNLRNFQKTGVDEHIVFFALKRMKVERVLPFRFITAARYAPQWESQLEEAMLECLAGMEKIPGHTTFLLDVSGSMNDPVSSGSELRRIDAACSVAMLLREICENVDIFTFSDELVRIPARRGFALRDAIVGSQKHNGTPLGLAVKSVYADTSFRVTGHIYGTNYRNIGDYQGQGLSPDRLIVITDEQSHDPVPDPLGPAYLINVASNKNGVGYGKWHHIDGWSEAVIQYIQEVEHHPDLR